MRAAWVHPPMTLRRADYSGEFSVANGSKEEEYKPYKILSEKYWLTYNTLGDIIGALLNNKALGVDGVKQRYKAWRRSTLQYYALILQFHTTKRTRPRKVKRKGLHLI